MRARFAFEWRHWAGADPVPCVVCGTVGFGVMPSSLSRPNDRRIVNLRAYRQMVLPIYRAHVIELTGPIGECPQRSPLVN